MRIDAYLRAACAASSVLFTAAMPAVAAGDTDACTLLTAAQVSAAIGITVGEGQHVTPTFVKTCTWTPSGSSDVKAVTLNMQTAATYDGGKRMAVQMAAASTGGAVQAASVGEDAYYFVTGDQAGLLVKKGGSSFKVAVYAKLPVEKKEAMELALAKQVAGKL